MKKTPSNSPFKRGEFKASALPSFEGGAGGGLVFGLNIVIGLWSRPTPSIKTEK